jgi:hypothetical protein
VRIPTRKPPFAHPPESVRSDGVLRVCLDRTSALETRLDFLRERTQAA